ncbi:hypothetical protein GOP47_0013978 [Adiantum capillus-veneris]|uniref:DUF1995 domain-containing protein n=1 Tax=Adiantum capillus-veneris TaxID=13818 RepID=A0A9D4UQI4_ADICA|nr:hypothetical protein GOP47_0013978 [Adiantum capillus-veneris]
MATASSSPTLRPFTRLPTLASCSLPLSLFRSPSLRRRPTCRHLRVSVSSPTCRHVVAATADAGMTTSDVEARSGVAVYRPSSYEALISDAAKALCYALDENRRRIEIEFPPLPSSISGYKGSSDEFLDANIQLVLALVRKLNEIRGVSSRVVFPDKPEKRRALRIFKSTLEMIDGTSFGSLDDIPGGGANNFLKSLQSALDFDFSNEEEGKWQNDNNPSLYFFVGCSTGELPAVETYVNTFSAEVPAIMFNLELDTLRADLGLFGFPSKEVHYSFLSQFLPVFYIRTRDYSKTIAAAPFVVDYTGALFRMYPGPWQVMLKQGDGSYVCVAESSNRFTLGQTKEELLTALGLQEEKGSTMDFLRRGYKNSTWWEDDVEVEKSGDWRS